MSKEIVHTHAGDDSGGKIWGIERLNIVLILAGLILSVGSQWCPSGNRRIPYSLASESARCRFS